jgi:hypothetical protein
MGDDAMWNGTRTKKGNLEQLSSAFFAKIKELEALAEIINVQWTI